MQEADVFSQNYLVCGLEADEIAEIEKLADIQVFLPQEFLCRKGEKSSDLFVILDGRVIVCTTGGDKLAEIGPGSVLGEIALVDDQPRSADAIAMGKVRVARFPAKEIRSYMAGNPQTGFTMLANLSRVLSMRLRKTDAALENLALHPQDAWSNSL